MTKRPPPVHCPITVINLKPNDHLYWLEFCLSYIRYVSGLLKFSHTAERCLFVTIILYKYLTFLDKCFDTKNRTCTLSLMNIHNQMKNDIHNKLFYICYKYFQTCFQCIEWWLLFLAATKQLCEWSCPPVRPYVCLSVRGQKSRSQRSKPNLPVSGL